MIIDGEKFLIFLDELIGKAEINVLDYEEFYEDKLANIPAMHPMDSFLYGVASGKLDALKYLRMLVEERIKELEV